MRLLHVEVAQCREVRDLCAEQAEPVAAEVEHAQPAAAPDGGRDEREAALGEQQDGEVRQGGEGCRQARLVVRVGAAQGVAAQVEAAERGEAAQVARHRADVVGGQVEGADVGP